MLHSYTPISKLSSSELTELRQRASLSEGATILSTGKAISPTDVQMIREQLASKSNRQQLFG